MKTRLLMMTLLAIWAGMLSAQNMFGAFQITTAPEGVEVSIVGSNQYLGQTPTQAFPVRMDQSMSYFYGTPGRIVNIRLEKDGYLSQTQEIFVPFTKVHERDALRHPTIFRYRLQTRPVLYPPQPPHHPGYGNPNSPHNPHNKELMVSTSPRGANIYINGQYVGQAPLRLDLKDRYRQSGRLTIRAEMRGYRTVEEIVSPRQNRVHLEMRRIRRRHW